MTERGIYQQSRATDEGISDPGRQAAIEDPDPRIHSIQPGGGVCMRLELAWGRARRWWLRRFAKQYVARISATRQGECDDCPHDILDPRDLKYYRNVCGYYWQPQDDPFAWRDRIPFARVGLAELLLSTVGLGLVAAILAWAWWPAAVVPLVVLSLIVYFFRDPTRSFRDEPGAVIAPADGLVVTIDRVEDEFVGEAWLIGIFLSVFNVHLNRSPVDAYVVGQTYKPGKFLNALRPRSAQENEALELRLQQAEAPYHRMRVRQIAGALARRIVCWVAPGDTLSKGHRFGMIKIGSRTELVLPYEAEVLVNIGDKVHAGSTIVAQLPTAAERSTRFADNESEVDHVH